MITQDQCAELLAAADAYIEAMSPREEQCSHPSCIVCPQVKARGDRLRAAIVAAAKAKATVTCATFDGWVIEGEHADSETNVYDVYVYDRPREDMAPLSAWKPVTVIVENRR